MSYEIDACKVLGTERDTTYLVGDPDSKDKLFYRGPGYPEVRGLLGRGFRQQTDSHNGQAFKVYLYCKSNAYLPGVSQYDSVSHHSPVRWRP